VHPVAKSVSAYALVTLAGFALLAAIALASGYRTQAAPVRAHFHDVAVARDGIVLHGVGHDLTYDFAWGWHECGGGHYEHSLERTGNTLEVDLVYRPDPHFGDCPQPDGNYDGQTAQGDGDGLFIPLDGPPPTTVTVVGDSTPHAVIDPDLGPVLPFDAGWETAWGEVPPDLGGDGVSVRSWSATKGDASFDVVLPVSLVGQAPDAWLRTGEIRRKGSLTGAVRAPSVDTEETIRLVGVPTAARLWRRQGGASVDVVAPDGRLVLRVEARAMTTDEVMRLVRTISAANP
jgi:hypothetical protein